uniref:Dopamine beta hydroxylase-like 1 n=1 Tax=Hofstenia miamia TaxID=442651 RepID=A0A7G7LK77_HOFMI|nr:dopamine beta hydroxylase-like 1 [Hofstenia miamia]
MQTYFNMISISNKDSISKSNAMLLLLVFTAHFLHINGETLTLKLPNVKPSHNNEYFCTSTKLSKDEDLFVHGFEASNPHGGAHHIMIAGCKEIPISPEHSNLWHCGEMMNNNDLPVCANGERIMYVEAMDSGPLKLPEDVSFHVGGESGINYLVIQVHYGHTEKFQNNHELSDDSGITLSYSTEPTPKSAGVYLLVADGKIPPSSKEDPSTLDMFCKYKAEKPIFPMFYRVHAHGTGYVISGFKIDEEGEWEFIGRKSPQLEQKFYPVMNYGEPIAQNDYLAARCTYHNKKSIKIGPTMNDEMCNFYILYWTEGQPLSEDESFCFEKNLSWENIGLNVPDEIEIYSKNLSPDEEEEVNEFVKTKAH